MHLVNIEALIDGFDPAKVHREAIGILSKIGLKVPREDVREELLLKEGVKVVGERCLFDEDLVEGFAEELRGRVRTRKEQEEDFKLISSRWPFFYVEPETLQVKPLTVKALGDFTRLLDSLKEEGVMGSIPGWPQDVPPPMRPIMQYYIECRFSRSPGFPGATFQVEIMEFLREMADVMGQGFTIGIETFSPLVFGGNSLNIALHYRDELESVGLDPMPIMGVSAPMNFEAGWAQSVAENLGAYTALRLLGFKYVHPSFRLFPASMASGGIAFGSPEYFLLLLTRSEIHRFYNIPLGMAESMLTTAKLPDQHAATEKSVQTAYAALAGYRRFEGAGMLALDEIFSPQQLIVDIEIRDYIEKSVKWMGESEADIMELVMEGLDKGEFLSAELTVNRWREFYWIPKLFKQTSRAQWEERAKKVLDEAWEIARSKISTHEYELDGYRRRELERIVERAKLAFG
jgi:trimethylamine:corrinoid methyltransferase-like protein